MSEQTGHPIYSQPLGENQIRILALQHGKEAEPLGCQIRLVNTLTEISYDAISYVWGS